MKTITVTKKDKKTAEGKTFPTYFTKNKNDEFVSVKFLNETPKFTSPSMDITIDEHGASYSVKEITYADKDGNTKTAMDRILFVKAIAKVAPHEYTDEWEDDFIDNN